MQRGGESKGKATLKENRRGSSKDGLEMAAQTLQISTFPFGDAALKTLLSDPG